MSKKSTAEIMGTLVGSAIVLAMLAVPSCMTYVECGDICEGQGAKRNWTLTQGCYCKDEDGVYNPKDERGKR